MDEQMIQDELALMAERIEIENNLRDMTKRYHKRLKEKNFELADAINAIINVYKTELDNVTRRLKSHACEVSTAQSTGDKRVFILER